MPKGKKPIAEDKRLVDSAGTAKEVARSLGFPDGWQVKSHGPRTEYTSPDGKRYKSLTELRASSELGNDFLDKLEANTIKEKGLQDAGEFGFPEGWKVKVYARAKVFYSPEGVVYNSLLRATEALKASMPSTNSSNHPVADSSDTSCELTRTGEKRQRGTLVLLGLPARVRKATKKSEDEVEADADASSHADSEIQPSSQTNLAATFGNANEIKQEVEAEADEISHADSESQPSSQTNLAATFGNTNEITDMHLDQHSRTSKNDSCPRVLDNFSEGNPDNSMESRQEAAGAGQDGRTLDDSNADEDCIGFSKVASAGYAADKLVDSAAEDAPAGIPDDSTESMEAGRSNHKAEKRAATELPDMTPPKRPRRTSGKRDVHDDWKHELTKEDTGEFAHLFSLQSIHDGSAWCVTPDDVISIDLDVIAGHIENAGWTFARTGSLCRMFEHASGESSLVVHETGKLLIKCTKGELAHQIAKMYINVLLSVA